MVDEENGQARALLTVRGGARPADLKHLDAVLGETVLGAYAGQTVGWQAWEEGAGTLPASQKILDELEAELRK